MVAGGGLLLVAVLAAGCASRGGDGAKIDGPSTQLQAEAKVREAIRRSSEGVIMLPSKKAERVFELPRLNEIAQALRQPFAACFLRRAIVTMTPRETDAGYDGVPEGQAKIRTRISAGGQVVRAEVLETGFDDEPMEACLTQALRQQRFPPNETGHTHFIDIVYWVSLGLQRSVEEPSFVERVRRETIAAAVRAKPCLQGRLDAGDYVVDGLNLVDREGLTLINRVQDDDLPEPVRACVAQAFQDVQLPRDGAAFVRPVASQVTFAISRDGDIVVDGEKWLRLVELEEQAKVAAKTRELEGEDDEDEADVVADGPPAPVGLGAAAPGGRTRKAVTPEPEPVAPPKPRPPRADPGEGGLRLNLGGRGGG